MDVDASCLKEKKGVLSHFRRKISPRPRAFRLAAPVVVEEAGRRALCPEPAEGAFGCARAAVGYNWDGLSFPYKQLGRKTSV